MNTPTSLHVVYIGPMTFPLGAATSKRRRYMVDYLNAHQLDSHYLVTSLHRADDVRTATGTYGRCTYHDLGQVPGVRSPWQYVRQGMALLDAWYRAEAKNVLVFHTLVNWYEWPFYRHALRRGYHVIFDQVETNYLESGTGSWRWRLGVRLSQWLSRKAYRHCPGFVISRALLAENERRFPGRRLCLLPNATPVIGAGQPLMALHQPLRLFYAGTFTPKDGVVGLLQGVIEANRQGTPCRLVLTGRGTAADMRVLDVADGAACIDYRGYVTDDELQQLMLESDVLCVTRTDSRFARCGFPFKLSEYLATGRVVLATDVGDVTCYVSDRESAYIIPPDRSDLLAQTLRHIADHPDEALRVARGGREAMQRHFAIEEVGRRFVTFLQEI